MIWGAGWNHPGAGAARQPAPSAVFGALASLDQCSEHPLAEIIVRAARERGMALDKPENFESGSGIDEMHGEVKPTDKLQLVERLQQKGRVMVMVSDGTNDALALALARADVGVAMGTGTDVAMNSD